MTKKFMQKNLEYLQLRKLKKTLHRARKSKFYYNKIKNVNLSSLDDIRKFEFTTKQDLRNHDPFAFLATSIDKISRYHESFGTTGVPTPSWFTKNDFDCGVEQVNRCPINFNENDIVLIRFPYAISVPAHKFHKAAEKKGACIIPASSRTIISPYTRIIKLIKKLRVSIICCLPLEAILLAETAKMMGYDPYNDFNSLRAIYMTGELCTKSRMKRISRLWNATVHQAYGMTELGTLGVTCNEGKLHCFPDYYLFEVIDPKTNEPVGEGETGELVVTSLYREAMPLIRYKTEDMVKIKSADECSCGIPFPILEPLGRKKDIISIHNKKVYFGDIMEAICNSPPDIVGDLWMCIINDNEILIRAESDFHTDDTSFSKSLSDILGVPIRLELVKKGELFNRNKLLDVFPVIKSRYIADYRKESKKPSTLDELLIGYHIFTEK